MGFAKTDNVANEFYLDVWSDTPPRFHKGTHEVHVSFWITIGNKRLIRTIVAYVKYEGGDTIKISKQVKLPDHTSIISS